MDFMSWRPNCFPQIFLCNGQSHSLHTKFRLSKCNFFTRIGWHENYVMSRKLMPPDFICACSVLEGWSVKENFEEDNETKIILLPLKLFYLGNVLEGQSGRMVELTRGERVFKMSGVDQRVVFQKGGFGGCSSGTKTGTRVHSDVPPERKPERGYVRMFPRIENRNKGTFAKTTLLRNRPFVSQWKGDLTINYVWEQQIAANEGWRLNLGEVFKQRPNNNAAKPGQNRFYWLATAARPRDDTYFNCFAYFGRWKTFRKVPVKCFKRPERGLTFFGHVSDRFSNLFSRFSNCFFLRQSKNCLGAMSFCRRAGLIDSIDWFSRSEVCNWNLASQEYISKPCKEVVLKTYHKRQAKARGGLQKWSHATSLRFTLLLSSVEVFGINFWKSLI